MSFLNLNVDNIHVIFYIYKRHIDQFSSRGFLLLASKQTAGRKSRIKFLQNMYFFQQNYLLWTRPKNARDSAH